MIAPELQEFIDDGESRVRSDVVELNARLSSLRKAGTDFKDPIYNDLFRVVLEACAHQGRGALDYDGCLKALFPFLTRFSSGVSLETWLPLIRRIAQRGDINKSTLKADFFGKIPLEQLEESSIESEDELPLQLKGSRRIGPLLAVFSSAIPNIGAIHDPLTFRNMVMEWAAQRDRHGVDIRSQWDVWFIRSALLQRRLLPLDYVDAVSSDDDFWVSESSLGFANSLTEPPRPEAIGRVAAALLNSRLRYLRPRLYLRSPESPVIQEIASRAAIAEAEDSFVEEIGYPFVRCLRLIRDELNRGPRLPPRRGMLADLEQYLGQVLDRLGVKTDDVNVSNLVTFDPSQHHSATQIEIGSAVRLLHAGLVDRQTGRRVFKAVVTTIDVEESESATRLEPLLDKPEERPKHD